MTQLAAVAMLATEAAGPVVLTEGALTAPT